MNHPTDHTRPVAAPGDTHALVVGVLKALHKLVHGRKLYADNNPRLAQFRAEFDAALRKFFAVEDLLVLALEQTVVRWNDRVVHEAERREDSIAFLLYKDGIGEVTIGEGAVESELDRLIDILAEEYHNTHSDEDVVTKFWNADFDHIAYRVLDDYLSSEYGEGLFDDADSDENRETADHEELLPSLEDKGRVIVRRDDPMESIDSYLKRIILRGCPSQNEDERETYFQTMVASFFAVNQEEITRYHDELARETQSDGLAAFAEAIFVFTMLQDNPSAVRDVSGVLERVLEYSVSERNPGTLSRLLRLVNEFRAKPNLTENVVGLCDKFLDRLAAPPLVREMGETISQWNAHAEQVLEYVRAVGRPAVDTVLRVMHHVEGAQLHKQLCDALIDISGDDIVAILDRLDVDKAEVAVDAVTIAGKIGISSLTPGLRELFFYPSVKVKEDMISLVADMDDSEILPLLIAAIDDEDKRIRLRAMEAASQRGGDDVRERLDALAFAKELSQRDGDEQEAIFRALGRVGNADTVANIARMLERKSLVPFARGKDNKLLALRALEGIDVPEALAVLDKLAEDTNSLVQTRARRRADALRAPSRAETEVTE